MEILYYILGPITTFCLLWYVEAVWDAWEIYLEEENPQYSNFDYCLDFFIFFFAYGYYSLKSKIRKWKKS